MQLQGRVQSASLISQIRRTLEPLAELQEDLLEERNMLSLQLRIDCEVDKLEDILSSWKNQITKSNKQ